MSMLMLLCSILFGLAIFFAGKAIIDLVIGGGYFVVPWFLASVVTFSCFFVMYNEAKIQCSVCGETIAVDVASCPSCGEPQVTALPDGTIDPATTPMDIADQPATVCESCEDTIEENDIFCPHCGNSLTKTAFCNNCGEPIDGDDTCCSYCGEPQT